MDHQDLRQRQFTALLTEMSGDEREWAVRAAAEHAGIRAAQGETSYAPPDPYASGIYVMRIAAEAAAAKKASAQTAIAKKVAPETPEQAFERRYKEERAAAFQRESQRR
jgi:hypothetical protein